MEQSAFTDTTQTSFGGTIYCPHCLQALPYVLPVEPLYDLRLAAQLVPMTHQALKSYLSNHRNEFLRRYRRDRRKRLHRMLNASEIRLIRSRLLRFKDEHKQKRAMAPNGN